MVTMVVEEIKQKNKLREKITFVSLLNFNLMKMRRLVIICFLTMANAITQLLTFSLMSRGIVIEIFSKDSIRSLTKSEKISHNGD